MKSSFDDVAKIVADGAEPPPWLAQGLALLSGVIKDTGTSTQREEYADQIERMKRAIGTLRRLLPLFLHLPVGRCPDDVLVVLDALPRIQRMLARVNLRPEKRTPDVLRKLCAEVIIEASRLVRGEVQHKSKDAYSAYNAYWKVCGNRPIGDDRNWERSIDRALAADNDWIRDIFQRLQALRMTP